MTGGGRESRHAKEIFSRDGEERRGEDGGRGCRGCSTVGGCRFRFWAVIVSSMAGAAFSCFRTFLTLSTNSFQSLIN
jgi:hypothetical protein